MLWRQAGDRSFQAADRSQILLQPLLVAMAECILQRLRFTRHGVENAFLALDPVLLLGAEEPIEQTVRNHFGRQRPITPGPAHIALNALAERLLANANLQASEPAVVA